MSASTLGRERGLPLRRLQAFRAPLLLLLGHVPFLVGYFSQLGRYDHYSFYPLAFLCCAYLIYDRLDTTRFRWNLACTALVVADLSLVAAGVVLRSPWPVWAGLLLGATACGLAARDKGYRGNLIHAVLPLLVLLRPPFAGDLQLIGWLQRTTTVVASKVLHRLGIVHFRSGNVLELPEKRLLVEEACSGIQSLFAVIFVALVIIALQRRRLVHGLLLLPFAFLWAAAFNVLRVLVIAFAWDRHGVDLSTGTSHTILGYVMLAIATLMTFSADQLLACFTAPMPAVSSRGLRARVVSFWNRAFAADRLTDQDRRLAVRPAPFWLRSTLATMVIAGVLVGSQLYAGTKSSSRQTLTTTDTFQRASLPQQLGPWHQDSYTTRSRNAANSLGEFSNSWVYASENDSTAFLSCDHSFEGWHDLEVCYVGQGWVLKNVTLFLTTRGRVLKSSSQNPPATTHFWSTVCLTRAGVR